MADNILYLRVINSIYIYLHEFTISALINPIFFSVGTINILLYTTSYVL
jgi:hypothetical protein